MAAGKTHIECRSREVIELVSGKWTLEVLLSLSRGTLRNGELRRRIKGISQKVLTQKVRELERAGLVRRQECEDSQVAKVEYSLTEDGTSLVCVVGQMHDWAVQHMDQVRSTMASYDRVRGGASGVGPVEGTTGPKTGDAYADRTREVEQAVGLTAPRDTRPAADRTGRALDGPVDQPEVRSRAHGAADSLVAARPAPRRLTAVGRARV